MMLNTKAVAQNLPQELLGEIFVLCLPRNAFDDLQPSPSLPPLVLCHICRSWRKAALGTPQLWTELSMEFGRVSTRSHGSGLFLGSLNTLEFWSSHMGALSPSLHFRRNDSWKFLSNEYQNKLVPFKSFFQSPAILNARSLTLDGFSNLDLLSISGEFSFHNIEYLALTERRKEHDTLVKYPTCPSLLRLYIDFHTWRTEPSRFVTAFSWVTITHLSANLRLGKQDWRATLCQCVNMTSCSVALIFLPGESPVTNSSNQPTFHHNLRTFSVQGDAITHSFVFDGFVFPSLVALRISCLNSTTRLKHVHRAIAATPALKEFHLHYCVPFSATKFLQYSQLAGPLSKSAPSLEIMVIDQITFGIQDPTNKDILTLLHSTWLNDGWATLSRIPMSVEFIIAESAFLTSVSLLVEDFNREIGRYHSLPFHASTRIVPGGLWNWQQFNAKELRDHWDNIVAFRCS